MTIGPVKALGCSPKLFIPDNVYFAAVLTLTLKVEKNTSVSDYRTVGPSGCLTVGLTGCHIIVTLPYQTHISY